MNNFPLNYFFAPQAALASVEVDSCLGLTGERSKSNSLLTNMASIIVESRHHVSVSRYNLLSRIAVIASVVLPCVVFPCVHKSVSISNIVSEVTSP